MKKPESICVFGDSIGWGAWDLEKGGWINRLWLQVSNNKDRDYGAEIYNLSISGGTTETILARFESESKIRNADAIIFQTGTNDASYKNRPSDYLVQPEKFRKNINEIIKRARKITNNLIFVGIKNCDESKTMPVSWISRYYSNDSIGKYNEIMKEICLKNKILFLDIGLLNNEDFDDGVHPNTKGHKKIYNKVKDFLTKNKWI